MNAPDTFVGTVTPPKGLVSPDMEISDALTTGVDVLLGLIASAAVIAVIASGIAIALSAGDEEKAARAKKFLFSALIGLVLSLSAWGIATIFFRFFTE